MSEGNNSEQIDYSEHSFGFLVTGTVVDAAIDELKSIAQPTEDAPVVRPGAKQLVDLASADENVGLVKAFVIGALEYEDGAKGNYPSTEAAGQYVSDIQGMIGDSGYTPIVQAYNDQDTRQDLLNGLANPKSSNFLQQLFDKDSSRNDIADQSIERGEADNRVSQLPRRDGEIDENSSGLSNEDQIVGLRNDFTNAVLGQVATLVEHDVQNDSNYDVSDQSYKAPALG